MKERENAEQAYIDAMKKMSMPAQIDLDRQIISCGSSKIRMKSKALAYSALAAVLALCIAVGVTIIHNKNSDDTPKIASSRDMTLEEDQTIPSEEIKSVEQAAEQYRKCLLLENDEYIKLKANKDNITKEMAESFTERIMKLKKRYSQCIDYISDHHGDKTLFVYAARFDNGVIDLSFHLDDLAKEQFEKLYEQGYGYYICRADSGRKLMRCTTEYRASPYDFGVRPEGEKLSTSDLEKLTGKLSLVMIGKNERQDRLTVIEEFEFFEKTFIGGEERAELDRLATQAIGKSEQ